MSLIIILTSARLNPGISASLSLTSRSSQTQLALAWTAESGETKVLLWGTGPRDATHFAQLRPSVPLVVSGSKNARSCARCISRSAQLCTVRALYFLSRAIERAVCNVARNVTNWMKQNLRTTLKTARDIASDIENCALNCVQQKIQRVQLRVFLTLIRRHTFTTATCGCPHADTVSSAWKDPFGSGAYFLLPHACGSSYTDANLYLTPFMPASVTSFMGPAIRSAFNEQWKGHRHRQSETGHRHRV